MNRTIIHDSILSSSDLFDRLEGMQQLDVGSRDFADILVENLEYFDVSTERLDNTWQSFDHLENTWSTETPQSMVLKAEAQTQTRPLSLVGRMFGLYVYGRHLLTMRGYSSMAAVGMLLLVVAMFDFVMWGGLINLVIRTDASWQLDKLTVIAFLLAIPFTMILVLINRNFLVAGRIRHMRSVLALVLRLGILCIGAFVTAIPVKLWVFDGAIVERLHKEAVAGKAYHALVEILREEQKKAPLGAESPDNENATVPATSARKDGDGDGMEKMRAERNKIIGEQVSVEEQLEAAESERVKAASNLEKAKKRLKYIRNININATKEMPPSEEDWARKIVSKARRKLREKVDAVTSIKEKVKTKRNILEAISKDLRTAQKLKSERMRDREKSAESRIQVLREEIRSSYESRPSESGVILPKVGVPGKLRILVDLYEGRPPRLPIMSIDMRQSYDKAFPFFQFSKMDTIAKDTLAHDAAVFRVMFWVIFCASAFVGFLAVLYKLLLPLELKTYFDIDAQAKGGNKGAQRIMWTKVRVDGSFAGTDDDYMFESLPSLENEPNVRHYVGVNTARDEDDDSWQRAS